MPTGPSRGLESPRPWGESLASGGEKGRKGTTANGTFYTVWRRLDNEAEYDTLGSVSAKSFTDTTLPVGTSEANYYLVTHRDELSSEATEPITVRFGSANQTGSTENTGDGNLSLAA